MDHSQVTDRDIEAFRQRIRSNDLAGVREVLDRTPAVARLPGKDGLTGLMVAVYARAGTVVDELRARADDRLDPFEAAALGDLPRLRRLLLERPDCVRDFSADGWTPLHLAAHFGRWEAIDLLLKHGAPVGAVARNAIANQPLQAAIAGHSPSAVRSLLAAGADPNHRSHGGFAAAHLAAEGDDVATLELLSAHGANLRVRADGGKTPVDIARDRGATAVVAWFRARDARPKRRNPPPV